MWTFTAASTLIAVPTCSFQRTRRHLLDMAQVVPLGDVDAPIIHSDFWVTVIVGELVFGAYMQER